MADITHRMLRNWADEIGISDLSLVEQDIRVSYAIRQIFDNEFLSSVLCLKGGTAINKLYFKDTSRLSVDLDFNHLGDKYTVVKQRPYLRKEIVKALAGDDPNYEFRVTRRDWYQTTIQAAYKPVSGLPSAKLKIEISHVERFPIVDKKTKSFKLIDTGESCRVITYSLDELLSTKLRALFTRARGRDIYDIYQANRMGLNKRLVRKMFIYYLFRAGKVYNPKVDCAKLKERLLKKQYIDDVTGYVRQAVDFRLNEAARKLTKDLQYLGRLDEFDQNFLLMSRKLKGEAIPKAKMKTVGKIKHPLDYVFHDSNITKEARKVTAKELLPWKQH
ncbi:MAG: putative nucleotidyltransferase component of viral defense system [Candidatus Nitrosomirales archaeon]|jgi:predicted nucleotidyltransferase component of viral defense system